MPVLDNLATFASIASLPALGATYFAFIRTPGLGRTIILSIAASVAIISYAADISDRLGWINLSNASPLLIGWGQHDDSFFEIINSSTLMNYKTQYNLLLIIRVPYGNIDSMTDTAIEKSSAYTITGQNMTLAIKMPTPGHLRVSPPLPPNSKIGDVFDVVLLTDFNLVIIPNNLAPEQFRSLSDVERLGGKTIATSATNVKYTATVGAK